MVKFCCEYCGHKLKTSPDRAGQRCKCPRCGQVLTVPSGKAARRSLLWGGVAVGLLAGAALVAFLAYPRDADRKLRDLKGSEPDARRQALLWFAGADVDGPHRGAVTAALRPLLFEGDARGDLKPDLVLRAYLHWAGPDNVPDMIRLVRSTSLPDWGPAKAGLVMQALGSLHDARAADILAAKLADPALRDQAVDALRLLGAKAQGAVLDHAFDDNADTRSRANQLLAEYGADPQTVAGEALARLQSNSPDARRGAATWFAESPPVDERQQAEVSRALTGFLDLSTRDNALALHALKLWATRDCLPQLIAFARRDEKAGACPPELLDVLARFPDESAAEAVALQLKVPANRALAAQALAKMGPAATKSVLQYLDYSDPAVRKEARWLCRELPVSAAAQLDKTLADIADARKPRARAALQALARLRPDDASRAKVSAALNAPLLDPDPGIRDDALNAARVWVSKSNTAALLKLLGQLRTGSVCDPRVVQLLGSLQDPAAASTLAEGLTRPQPELDADVKALVALGPAAEDAVLPYLQSSIRGARFAACWVLGEIGTPKSVAPLEKAGNSFFGDNDYNQAAQIACEKILARQ